MTDTTSVARGSFDVTLTPLSPSDGEADIGAGRMAIDKVFHGDLDGTSQGQMIGVRTAVDGSAGYVWPWSGSTARSTVAPARSCFSTAAP